MTSKRNQATVRRLLKDFEKAILATQNDQVVEGVWSVLTGLRGSDDPTYSTRTNAKYCTTTVIRIKALPNLVGLVHYEMSPDVSNKLELRNTLEKGHFKDHAKRAFEALGLDWDAVNK